jgi:hypothetical protein
VIEMEIWSLEDGWQKEGEMYETDIDERWACN